MSVDYSGIQNCTYGSVSLSLTTYQVRTYAQVKDGLGRVGTIARFEGDGELVADTPAALTSALANVIQQLQQDGRDLSLTGINSSSEVSILGAQCLNGGPHIEFEIHDGPTACSKTIKIRAWSELVLNGNTPVNNYKSTVLKKPDGLLVITWTGEVNGANAPGFFVQTVVPLFTNLYAPPAWRIEMRYEYGAQLGLNPKVLYTLTASEFFGSLPAIDTNNFAVDGDATVRTDRDEQQRKTTVYDFNVLVIGDAQKLAAQIRAQLVGSLPSPAVIQRESTQINTLKENRIRATYVVLTSGDSSALMNWTESARIVSNFDTFVEKTYIGADPILVQNPPRFGRLIQSGSATAASLFKVPPKSQYPVQGEPPAVTYTDLNETEKQTQWEFVTYLADQDGNEMTETDVDTLHPLFLGRTLQDTTPGGFFEPPDPSKHQAP